MRSCSGAVTALRLGSHEVRDPAGAQRQGTETRHGRRATVHTGSGRRLGGLDRLEDELTEVLQERVRELEEPGLRDALG